MVILFYFSLTPIFAYLLEYPLIKMSNDQYVNNSFSAVLVPTAGIYKDYNSKWHPSSNSILRVSIGESLAKKYRIPLIISGGKIDLHSPAESKVISNILNFENLILETRSRSSYETSINLNNIMIENNIDTNLPILLVTSPKHSLRMVLLLNKQKIMVKRYFFKQNNKISFKDFIPSSKTISTNNASLYEYIGIIYYFFKGYI